jgi:hypothetical protein
MNEPEIRKLKSTVHLLKALIPETDEILAEMEQNGGWFPLCNAKLLMAIKNLKLDNWAEFYLDEKKVKALPLALLMNDEQLKEAVTKPEEVLEELKAASLELLNEDIPTPSEAESKATFEAASEEEQAEFTRAASLSLLSLFVGVFNTLAGMVHGQSLCKLVSAAKNGNDDALCKAIQIDRTILFLPFVKDRMIKAQLSNDQAFLTSLAYRLKQPILKGKIRYRTLWLTFALLDDEGFLSLPHNQLLDICEEIGVYGKEHGIEDVGHLRKRLQDYRAKNRN